VSRLLAANAGKAQTLIEVARPPQVLSVFA
jgi:hypothetical protein